MTGHKRLQYRIAVFLLCPVAILLLGMGVAGFFYSRDRLLEQWAEAAVLKLQRAAHMVDMQLSAPKELLLLFHRTEGNPYASYLQESIVHQLRQMDGVERVEVTWFTHHPPDMRSGMGTKNRSAGRNGDRMMHMRQSGRIAVTFREYNALHEDQETVSLILDLNDKDGKTIGRIEAVLRFEHLIRDAAASGWFQSDKTFLVDQEGLVLAGNFPQKGYRLGHSHDPLEEKTLQAIQKQTYGTIFGDGHPPSEIVGFYRLTEAPWHLITIAPGKKILEPILTFRTYYFLCSIGFIFLILVLILLVTRPTAKSITAISEAAQKVARGEYDQYLPVGTQDEVGELTRSFNTMVSQLEERMRIKEALDVAMEVQQNLLPRTPPKIEGIDTAGKSIYCDETGGDYYDYLVDTDADGKSLRVIVGDVSGHGIASALLMATVRAFLRQRSALGGQIGPIVTDVNRQLVEDVEDSGRFVTLFYLLLDLNTKSLQWIRAGHDPGMLYDPATDSFFPLHGPGIALGISKAWEYELQKKKGVSKGQIILLGTDGIREARNPEGQMFGTDAIRESIRQNASKSSEEILNDIFSRVQEFKQGLPFEDDLTAVVIKITQ